MELTELIEIAKQIEETGSERGDFTQREFVWLYNPPNLMILLQIPSFPHELILGYGNYCIPKLPENPEAKAIIHNHTSGCIAPSIDDVLSFLYSCFKIKGLEKSLIAGVVNKQVGGYLVMEFCGARKEAKKLHQRAMEEYCQLCDIRQKDIHEHPEKYPHITWGDFIFTREERIEISLRFMREYNITYKCVPLPGFRIEGWNVELE